MLLAHTGCVKKNATLAQNSQHLAQKGPGLEREELDAAEGWCMNCGMGHSIV